MDSKTRNFSGFIVGSLVAGYLAMFHLNPMNAFVYVFLKIIAVGVIPSTICFSWLYFWREYEDSFQFLVLWNTGTQLLFLMLNLVRIKIGSWGIFGWTYIVFSLVLVVVYMSRYPYTRWGFTVTGIMILLNVLIAFTLVMTTFDYMHPVFVSENLSIQAMGSFITELSVMGALFSSSSQLYWHDILKKRREDEIVEKVFESLERPD